MQNAPWQYRLGLVVERTIKRETSWGHVVGFKKNPSGEVIINVQWDDGSTYPVHPNKLKTLDDFCA